MPPSQSAAGAPRGRDQEQVEIHNWRAKYEYIRCHRKRQHWLEVFKTWYGPVVKAYAAIDPDARTALDSDLHALIARLNRSGDGSMIVPSEYLEIVITRR